VATGHISLPSRPRRDRTYNWARHPPVHDEGWMVSGQETVFCCVPVS